MPAGASLSRASPKPYYSTALAATSFPMADSRYQTLLQHEHIDLRKTREVELWTDVLGIFTADLFNAVAAVGTSSSAVLRHILDNGLVGRASRVEEPRPRRGKSPEDGATPSTES